MQLLFIISLGLLPLLTSAYPASLPLPTVLSVEDYEGNFKKIDILSTLENGQEAKATYYLSNFEANWQTASDSCVNLIKKDFVSIQNSTKSEEIKSAIRAGEHPTSGYWTSGKFSTSRFAFVWTASDQGFTYTNWLEGDYNHDFNLHACVYVWNSARNFHSYTCSVNFYFICE